MSIERGGVSIPVGADLKPLEKGLKKAEGLATRFSERIRKAASGAVWDGSSFVAGLKMSSKEFDQFIGKVNKAKEEYQDLVQLSEGLKDSGAWSQIGEKAQKSVESALSVAKTTAEAYDRTLKHIGRGQRLRTIFDGLKNSLAAIGRGLGQILSGVVRWGKRLGLAAIAAGLVMLKQGMENLYNADTQTRASIDSVRNALAGLKNALAAAFAPILNFVAPILTKFIGMLTNAANAVGMFFAALTGKKTATIATNARQASSSVSKVAGSIGNIGHSASQANKKAKELKRTLLGFDQINKLEKDEDEGDYDPGYTDMPNISDGLLSDAFESADIPSAIEDFVKKLKDAWEKGNFYDFGKSLAEKLNNALASIKWDKIKATCKKIADSIATFLNGFIENTDWKLVGHTLSEAIKTALDFGIELLDKINWEAIGKAIVDFICGIDWLGLLGKSLKLMMKLSTALIEVLFGAVKELVKNIPEIFKSVGEAIGNWFTEHFGTKTGASAYSMDLSVGVDLIKKGWSSVSKFVGDAVTVAVSLTKRAWSTIQAFVGTAVNVAVSLFKQGWNTIQTFVGTAVKVAVSLLKRGWSSIAHFVGTSVRVGVSLFKQGWSSIQNFVGTSVSVGVSLVKSGWSSLSSFVGSLGSGSYSNSYGTYSSSGTYIAPAGGYFHGGYASGGMPRQGQLFYAREDGPELVGTIKGHSAVMNNDQIVMSVARGVAEAMAGVRFQLSATPQLAMASSAGGTSVTPQQNNTEVVSLLKQLITEIKNLDTDVYLDGESIKNNTVERINNHTRATGQLEIEI